MRPRNAQQSNLRGIALVAALVALPHVAHAGTFIEAGDAGSVPAEALVIDGTGPLDSILGTFLVGVPDTDLYRLHFDAGTVGAWVQFPMSNASASPDARLFLFDATGRGILGTPIGGSGYISWALASSGEYLLGVTQGTIEPFGPKGTFGNDYPIFLTPMPGSSYLGPNGPAGADPVAGWGGTYHGLSGPYEIHLAGASFIGEVPAPAPLALLGLGLGVLGLASSRRHRQAPVALEAQARPVA